VSPVVCTLLSLARCLKCTHASASLLPHSAWCQTMPWPCPQALCSLPEGLASAVLHHTRVPLAQLVVTLPPRVRIAATAARTSGRALLLSGQFCSSMKRAQDVVQALSLPIVKALSTLTELDLSSNRMGPHEACIAMPLLARLPHLVTLNLSNNMMGSQGFEMLTTYLHDIPLLKVCPLGVAAFEFVEIVLLEPTLLCDAG
jgi:hypothetical protein